MSGPPPVGFTERWCLSRPVLGEIELSAPGGTITVNVTALLVPAGDVTVTFLAPPVAKGESTSAAVTWLSLTAVSAGVVKSTARQPDRNGRGAITIDRRYRAEHRAVDQERQSVAGSTAFTTCTARTAMPLA